MRYVPGTDTLSELIALGLCIVGLSLERNVKAKSAEYVTKTVTPERTEPMKKLPVCPICKTRETDIPVGLREPMVTRNAYGRAGGGSLAYLGERPNYPLTKPCSGCVRLAGPRTGTLTVQVSKGGVSAFGSVRCENGAKLAYVKGPKE